MSEEQPRRHVETIPRLVRALPEAERQIVTLTYGFAGEPLPLKYAAKVARVTQAKAGELLGRAVLMIWAAIGDPALSSEDLDLQMDVAALLARVGDDAPPIGAP